MPKILACRQQIWRRMHSRLLPIACVLATLTCPPVPAANAQLVDPPDTIDAKSAKVIKQLLEDDWLREAENQATAQSTYTSQQPTSTAVSLAYLLNRIQHNETREAIRVAEQLVRQDPDSIDGWLIKSWLNALINKYDRSLIDLLSLQKRMLAKPGLSENQETEIYQRMGKLMGYMQGPVQNKVSPDLIQSTLTSLAKGLQPVELEAFNSSRETVLSQYDKLAAVQTTKTEIELEKQQAENEIERASLLDQNQLLDETLQRLSGQREELTLEGNRRISDLNSQRGPLESELGTVSTQIRLIQNDLQLLSNSLFYAQHAEVVYEPTIFYLINRIRELEFQLYSLRSQADSVANQIQLIQAQINQTRRDYNGQIRDLTGQQNQAEKSKTRNRARLSRLAGNTEIAGGKKEAMSNRLTALTSYYDLPVELYRRQMLDLVE